MMLVVGTMLNEDGSEEQNPVASASRYLNTLEQKTR